MLQLWWEQFQKAKERGHANLASIAAATSSLHMDTLSISSKCHCKKCGYSHPCTKCPAKGQQYYVCSGYNHFTALCQQRGWQQTKQTLWRGHHSSGCSVSSHCRTPCCTSHSLHRHHHHSPNYCSTSRTPTCSPSCSPSHSTLPLHSAWSNRYSTPHRYYQDALEVIPADSITNGSWAEGKPYTECFPWPSSILQLPPAPSLQWCEEHDCQDRPWCSSQHHPLEQVLCPFPQKAH